MMSTVMQNFQHLTQDWPDAESHVLVALPGQPLDRFEVTEVIRQGTSLVLQCQPLENGNDPEPPSPRDDSDHSFYKNDDIEFLSRHDPYRFYEDLR
jgi:hypothetical protein